MLRIVLFIATNLAVMLLLTLVVKLTGLDVYAYRRGGLDLQALLVLAAVMGMGGSFISLAMSKWIAKMSVRAEVIAEPRNPTESWLVATVRSHAEKAGIGMPEVAIYDAPEMNAFATGMSKNHALVAVSTGLLQSMDREQLEAARAYDRFVLRCIRGTRLLQRLRRDVSLQTKILARSRHQAHEIPGVDEFVAEAGVDLGIENAFQPVDDDLVAIGIAEFLVVGQP